jgi:polysaccharide biosynthesis/export protein
MQAFIGERPRSTAGRDVRSRAAITLLTASALCAVLMGCAAVPDDGPTPHAMVKAARQSTPPFALVDLTYAATQEIAAHSPATIGLLAAQTSTAPNDLIADGDDVSVSIFEPGDGGLFARSLGPANLGVAPVTPQSGQQALPRLVVDRDGDLDIPYAGEVHVAGLTPRDAAEQIRRALSGKAVDPQVNLVVTTSRANTVGVLGAVKQPGQYPLSPSHDHLLDILEAAGGTTRPPGDALVVVYRDGRTAAATLADIMVQPADNIRLGPKDEIRVLEQPRKFSTFGAVGRSTEVTIEDESLTLAAALSRAGGLDTFQANPRWVMVFRFERPEIARALGVTQPATRKGVPIVYRLNLQEPQGYFVAGNFDVQSHDLIYAARADLFQAQKFLNFVQTLTAIDYNLSVQAAAIP